LAVQAAARRCSSGFGLERDESVGVQGLDDGNVIHNLGEVGQKLGNLGARLAVFGEFEFGAKEGRRWD